MEATNFKFTSPLSGPRGLTRSSANRAPTNRNQSTASSRGARTSVFRNANNVRIKNSAINIVTNQNTISTPKLNDLFRRVAPNAILNEGGRADNPKCHPGTRKEVIGLIERWMTDPEGHRILWLSGPAGAGKSAIMKTVAERASVNTIKFFFFRGDPTRNHPESLAPTLLYQIFQLYPQTVEAVDKIVASRPRILDESFAQQCKLISALFPVIRDSSRARHPSIILLIDGLDECDDEGQKSQIDVLCALEKLVGQVGSPFRLLIASRPEAHLQMAFNQLSSHVRSIFLNEDYSPEHDIRIFVQAEFDKLKTSHPSKHALPHRWPSALDIEEIIAKSSGQFIYAATVMRYLSHPFTVPSLSLERVKGISSPTSSRNSPFKHLDRIYTFILDRARDRDAVQDMLSTRMVHTTRASNSVVLGYYNSRYNRALIQSCISELSAIVRLDAHGDINFYHASLSDFLVDQTRSRRYFVDVDAFRAKLLVELWRRSRDMVDSAVIKFLLFELFHDLEKPTPDVTHMLLNVPVPTWMTAEYDVRDVHPGRAIQALYFANDIKSYKRILRRIIFAMMSLDHGRQGEEKMYKIFTAVPYAREYISFYRRWNWWFQIVNKIRRKN